MPILEEKVDSYPPLPHTHTDTYTPPSPHIHTHTYTPLFKCFGLGGVVYSGTSPLQFSSVLGWAVLSIVALPPCSFQVFWGGRRCL